MNELNSNSSSEIRAPQTSTIYELPPQPHSVSGYTAAVLKCYQTQSHGKYLVFVCEDVYIYPNNLYSFGMCLGSSTLSQNESRETAPERVQQEDAIVENESNNIIRKLNAGKYEKPRK